MSSRQKQEAPSHGLSGRHLTDVENLVPKQGRIPIREGGMTEEQTHRIVEHLCEQLHLAIRLKGSEAHPPNAKEIGFDPASVTTVLRTGLKLAGVSVVQSADKNEGEEPPWSLE
jgi:hypothetical protein